MMQPVLPSWSLQHYLGLLLLRHTDRSDANSAIIFFPCPFFFFSTMYSATHAKRVSDESGTARGEKTAARHGYILARVPFYLLLNEMCNLEGRMGAKHGIMTRVWRMTTCGSVRSWEPGVGYLDI